jgi:thiamine biosynthesis lipoprotein
LPPDSPIELLDLQAGGVATSGRDYRRWQQNGAWQHHLIDPRSGVPADTDVLAATIIAPSAGEAEIAAKVVLLLGSAAGLDWLDARPTLAGLLVLESGEVLYSRRLPDFLEPA